MSTGDRLYRRIPRDARSVAWCSASIWSAPDESGPLTLGASSIWSGPDGSRRIVWMINGMIKHLDRSTAEEAEESRRRSQPSTFRLRVGTKPSSPSSPGASWLLTSGASSDRC
jgi:hypothetical protein